MYTISVIIPAYNESESIVQLIQYLQKHGQHFLKEIIVVDGGSTDETVVLARRLISNVFVSPQKGRAAQMNHGAEMATGDILYFVHADTYPPASYTTDIIQAIEAGYLFGRYRTKFNSPKKILKLNAWFTRFDLFICYGGDQTLFMTRALFDQIGGFDDQMRIMEDYDIVLRAKKIKARYKIFSKPVLVSARKYETNSWLRVQTANYIIIRMYKKGAVQEAMIHRYKTLLNYR